MLWQVEKKYAYFVRMRLLGITFCFLPCLFLMHCSAEGDCNEEIFEALKYCGNVEKWMQYADPKENSELFQYIPLGGVCYTNSRSRKETPHRDWLDAQSTCEKDGGKLAEFSSKRDYDNFDIDRNVYDRTDFFWIGARRRNGNWTWHKLKTKIVDMHVWSRGGGCLLIYRRDFEGDNCANRRPFFCQIEMKEAYEGKGTLMITRSPDGIGNLKVGDLINITCKAKTDKILYISVTLRNSVKLIVYDEGKKQIIMNGVEIEDIVTSRNFFYSYKRCFQEVKLRLLVKVNLDIRGAIFTCTRLMEENEKQLYGHYDDSLTLDFNSVVKLQIYNISYGVITGRNEIRGCNKFLVSCTGFGITRKDLLFEIIVDQKIYKWKFPRINELPHWVEFKWAKEINDEVHGPTFRIMVGIITLPVMANAKFVCTDETIEGAPTKQEQDLSLSIIASFNLPPTLTSKNVFDDDTVALVLNCKANLGMGRIHTWVVRNTVTGTENTVQVERGGNVHGITFDWFNVIVSTDGDVNLCTPYITSTLTVKKTVPKSTFTCYSYDVTNVDTINSGFSLKDLQVTYTHPNTGGFDDTSYEKDVDHAKPKDTHDDDKDKKDEDEFAIHKDDTGGVYVDSKDYEDSGLSDEDKDDEELEEDTVVYSVWYVALVGIGLVMWVLITVVYKSMKKDKNKDNANKQKENAIKKSKVEIESEENTADETKTVSNFSATETAKSRGSEEKGTYTTSSGSGFTTNTRSQAASKVAKPTKFTSSFLF